MLYYIVTNNVNNEVIIRTASLIFNNGKGTRAPFKLNSSHKLKKHFYYTNVQQTNV